MNRNNLHNEENFWPCVSDMFLALFVIALVLYSTMSAEKGRGDEYISELAEMEACSLVEFLKKKYPASVSLESIDLASVRQESGAAGSRPELTGMLYALLDCPELAPFYKKKHLPKVREERYTEAILALYMATSESGKSRPDEDALDYNNHVLMREVRERIERNMTDKQMLAEMERLRKLLADSVTKAEYDALKNRYDALKNRYDVLAATTVDKSKYDKLKGDYDILNLRYEELNRRYKELAAAVASIQEQLAKVRQELKEERGKNATLTSRNAYLENQAVVMQEQIQKMIDVRVNVMAKVEALLNSKYPTLVKAGVKVEAKKGIIVVPSSVFAFPKATTRYYQQGKGIVTADLKHRLEDELEREHRENLKQLAAFLDEIGQRVKAKKLQVDNIAIECHTDNDVSKIKDTRFYNDGLSLQRAFDAWRLLDQYADGNLALYRNAAGQGLFSMTGFGARVLPEKRYGEKKETYEERCRRMQIRFNCLPVAGKENNSGTSVFPASASDKFDDLGLDF